MKTRIAVVISVVVAAGAGLFVGGEAYGVSTYFCTGTAGTGLGFDDVIVPSGSTCHLPGNLVFGDVHVRAGGRLITGGGTNILGSLTSNGAGTDPNSPLGGNPFSILVCDTGVLGKISITRANSEVTLGGTTTGGGVCGGNHDLGTTYLAANRSALEFTGNATKSDVVVRGTAGPTDISNNNVADTLLCRNNGGLTSSGNTAAGGIIGQCA